MEKRRIDVKLPLNRFTWDRVSMDVHCPVAIQARGLCGSRDDVHFMQLSVPVAGELCSFLAEVLWQEGLRKVEEDVEKKD